MTRLLGTPTEENWPGVTHLRDWHEYPGWKSQKLTRVVPTLEPKGCSMKRHWCCGIVVIVVNNNL
jgi:cyclin-dependent kinase